MSDREMSDEDWEMSYYGRLRSQGKTPDEARGILISAKKIKDLARKLNGMI